MFRTREASNRCIIRMTGRGSSMLGFVLPILSCHPELPLVPGLLATFFLVVAATPAACILVTFVRFSPVAKSGVGGRKRKGSNLQTG